MIQVQFSLVSTLPVESGLIDVAKDLNVRLIAYSPLGLGLLTGKYNEKNLPSGPRGLIFKELLPELKPVLSVMDEIAKQKPGRTYSQVHSFICLYTHGVGYGREPTMYDLAHCISRISRATT
jgi:pyridoxine 4-dehydrogenase